MKSTFLNACLLLASLALSHCSRQAETASDGSPEPSKEVLITRGKYLTTVGGCNDCHSPKVMTPNGPEPDTTRLFSGHPRDEKFGTMIKTSEWLVMNNGFTAFIGPWGMSFAANLTPHYTGIGSWDLDQFMTAIRKGKSKGLENNRPLLPPMPWQMYRNMTDEDLKAIFTYLKSLPPVDNLVPVPVSREKL